MDKNELYNQAKKSYYNGEPIMSDLEFDNLESELGLENSGYVGTHHQKDYTIKHPFVMGSLCKVQVKKEKDDTIDFGKCVSEIKKYLTKSRDKGEHGFEASPKLDGVSFEVCMDYKGDLISVSTRGDSEYGKDVKMWFEPEFEKSFKPKVRNWIDYIKENDMDSYFFLNQLVVRGEILIDKETFMSKYSKDFTIPRSFVSGVVNQDWEGTSKQMDMRNDLSWVCYDYREVYDNGAVFEIDYNDTFPGQTIDYRKIYKLSDINDFKSIYEDYENYRMNMSKFELDGIVIKPIADYRLQDLTRTRPEDCVAIKFTPEVVETEIIDIEWNVGKTGEYFPTGILKEVILGGKKINRVSLHNFNWIMSKKCGVGAKVIVSLAGDIIPHILQVIQESNDYVLPHETFYTITDQNSACIHLMKKITEIEKRYFKFINSVKVLKPAGIGEVVADMLFHHVSLGQADNILDLMTLEGINTVKEKLHVSKSTDNIVNALQERIQTLTLSDVIESCGFSNCGPKNSLWLAKKYSGLDVSYDGVPISIIELSKTEDFHLIVKRYVDMFNLQLIREEKITDQIPVILTGDTSNTSYKTKKEWLIAHPQYREATSWKECKILFTNDLDSKSSKMNRAKKCGVEIRLYE
ncbi:MAG: hypothetical protein NC548_40530 [Lachnospiraceae bacterium]|nr:hypothetical protein [Lachnospiraceae bacterium]